MHDVAVALDCHQLIDPLGAIANHPADVVAGKVHQHDVLGALFRVLDELGLEPSIFFVARAASARSGDRPGHDTAVQELDHRFWRGTDDRDAALAKEEHVRARVDLAQHTVDIERVTAKLEVESLGEDDLEGVTCPDVLLGHFDGAAVAVRARAPANLLGGQGCLGRRRRRQLVVTRSFEVDAHGL